MSSVSETGNEDAGAHAAVSAGPGAGTASSQESLFTRPHVMLALKLLAGMLIIAAPALVMNSFLPGFFSVAFYGVLAASFAWVSGGPKIAAIVVASLSTIAIFVIWQREHLAVLAAVLILLGIGYGYASSRGIGKALLQLPILAPYFMMASPPLFSDPPTHDLRYLIGFVLTMNAMGLWTILVLHVAIGRRTLTVTPVDDRRVPLITGTLLGVVSAAVMLVALTSGLKMHWVWVTLTLYLLVEPTQRLTSKHTFGRVLGTFAGFGLVAVLTLVGVPDAVLQVLAIPAAWMCLFFLVMKRPYSQYSFFLTVAVVGMNQRGVNTLLIDAERFVFTIVGALLAVCIAALANLLVKEPAAPAEPSGDTLTT